MWWRQYSLECRLNASLQIKEVGDKIYVLLFGNDIEKQRVLYYQQSSFNRALLILQTFEGQVITDPTLMAHSPLWIVIGESIGEIEEVSG